MDWAELNTAWGLAVLLLRALVTRVQLQLRSYELVPYGDQSYIKLLDGGKVLPLYWHGSGRLELQTATISEVFKSRRREGPCKCFHIEDTNKTLR